MKGISEFICKNKNIVLIITVLLLIPALIGMKNTKINYNILVYLPDNIETVKGQNMLTDDFNMGAFSVTVIDNMSQSDIVKLENKIKSIDGVANVASVYDVIGTTIPVSMFPNEIVDKVKEGKSDLMLITFDHSTSDEITLNAVKEIKNVTGESCKVGGMSAMALDTMELSETEIMIYIVIAVLLCILVLELSLDSYVVPFILLVNIGIAILFNMGTNFMFGEISYITKALAAVLQLGVTTDFSIFLYHAYEKKKKKDKEKAMSEAIQETFTSVIGSSLTTIAGFLVLCLMQLTLGRDLGLVMAKGVLLGVVSVLTIFPSLLLAFDNIIEKTKHKSILPKFSHLNSFIVKHYKTIFVIFLLLIVPVYLANSKVSVYYKLDKSLPDDLDSIVANTELAQKFNIVSPEIILINKDIKVDKVNSMIEEIKSVDGIDFALSFSSLEKLGISKNMLSDDTLSIFESENYQMILINSNYEIASTELNEQIKIVDNIIKKYDSNDILAGEGPLMSDLVAISDIDFNNVNTYSMVCILLIMFIVLKSFSLPILLIISIEAAIFLNMAIPYFGGITLPFIAPIVLGTIQLGATIDYAILLTTTYLKNRKNNNSEYAMRETLNNCVGSIIVSGLCFFGATFGVGAYSKLEMISSLCTLISRGAIISMFMVIIVLPAILLMFDKVIVKTTYDFKGGNMKKIITCLIISLLFVSPVEALTKDETVYTKLNSDGSINNTIVNEHLINDGNTNIDDESDLKDILNLNSDDKFTQDEFKINWETNNDIFYQGTTDKNLPVSLNIIYTLDGVETALDDMIGKSGHVAIKLKYTNNDVHYVSGINKKLYTPFVVTFGTTINGDNVTITNGKVVNNGSSNVAVGIATPGLYESLNNYKLKEMDTIILEYDTDKFELSTMYSIITPKVLSSEDLTIFNKMDDLLNNVDELQSSINEIELGTKSLIDGTNKINDGTKLLYEKLDLVTKKVSELNSGSILVDDGLKQILASLTEAQDELANTDTSSIAQIQTLIQTNTNTIKSLTAGDKLLKSTYDNYHLADLTNAQVLAMNEDLLKVKINYENNYVNNEGLILLLTNNNNALTLTLNKLNETNGKLTNMINGLQTNITKLEMGSKKIADGTGSLTEALTLITTKANELSNGTGELLNGVTTLSNGVTQFNQEGITSLTNYVGEFKSLESETKALIKLGEDYTTFTRKTSNTKGTTKFVLVVDGKKQEEQKTDTLKKETKSNLWTRIKDLFR